MEGATAGSSLAKDLASCNTNTRNKALKLLKTWLPSQNHVSDDVMKKIWKGLFYCVWHADKQPVQIELINRLAFLLVSLDLPLSIKFFEVFLTTIRREWSGIDFLRLDKFYLLIRRFFHHFFLLLKRNSWDPELLSVLVNILQEKTLFAADKYPAQGVNYHISEVFLEELKPFLPINLEIIDALIGPFLSIMKRSSDKVILSKIKSGMFDCLLKNGKKHLELKKAGQSIDSGDEVELFGTIALTLGISTKLFNLGASSDCLQGNRKVLFSLHEDFLKLEKDLVNTGFEILLPQSNNENIPVTKLKVHASQLSSDPDGMITEIANGLANKSSKKKKKAEKARNRTYKKVKMEKNGLPDSVLENSHEVENKNGNGISTNLLIENSNEDPENKGNIITYNETAISNLQMQFEKIATESGMDTDCKKISNSLTGSGNETMSKKRKRVKNLNGQISNGSNLSSKKIVEKSGNGKDGEKSTKKVRFSMRNNLMWKPHTPLPSLSLRLPPSSTPRGSALKKGVSPGPIRETPPMTKKVKKRASSLKKGRKNPKPFSPAKKCRRKLKSRSV